MFQVVGDTSVSEDRKLQRQQFKPILNRISLAQIYEYCASISPLIGTLKPRCNGPLYYRPSCYISIKHIIRNDPEYAFQLSCWIGVYKRIFFCERTYETTMHYTAIRWLVHWPWMGGLLHLVQRGGAWVCCAPRPLLAVPNVTAHPSTATVPT